MRPRKLNGKAIVTGGAGFIGSHLVDSLMKMREIDEVAVIDNLSSGSLTNVDPWISDPRLEISEADLLEISEHDSLTGSNFLFHFAANPDVRVGSAMPNVHFEQNIRATYNVLELARKIDINLLAFASTSTVYGEAKVLPTPENYGPLKPISIYGASKLSCEALISAYASTYGFNAVIFRLANIIGPRSSHGIIYDFVSKMTRNPYELEILGDGKQNKSYLFIDDCIRAILTGVCSATNKIEIFNVGSDDQIDVMRIAHIVGEEMGVGNVRYRFTSDADDGRGWAGDVKTMLLDTSKLKSHGWRLQANSEEAVRLTARELSSKTRKKKLSPLENM